MRFRVLTSLGLSSRRRSYSLIAGSIFPFSLTLGDYITPRLVSNDQFIGNVIFNNISNNLPLASALAVVPIVVMIAYLMVARKLGAFEHV